MMGCVMSELRPEEIYVKKQLEDSLGVIITPGSDPPDLEFELNEKLIGVEIVRVMKKITEKLTTAWLEDTLQKIIPPCLESFEDKYAQSVRSMGETGCFICRVEYGNFIKNADSNNVTYSAVKSSIEKAVTQGLKVIFKLDEVKNEEFFWDEGNLFQLIQFWNGNFPGSPVDSGFVEMWGITYVIKTEDLFDISIIRGSYKNKVPGDKLFDSLLFDDPSCLLIDEGASNRNEVYEDFRSYFQDVIREKKETCSQSQNLGQRSEDKYDELWLYIHNELGPNQFFIREDMKATRFNFENYWSKVYCSNISLKGDRQYP